MGPCKKMKNCMLIQRELMYIYSVILLCCSLSKVSVFVIVGKAMSSLSTDTSNIKCINDGTFLIGVVPSSISLLIVIWISFKSLTKFKKQQKAHKLITIAYYLSCILLTTVIITRIIASVYCTQNEGSTYTIGIPSYYIAGLCLLATLFTRVYSTFKESILQITKYQKILFIVLFCINVLFFGVSAVAYDIFGGTPLVNLMLICNMASFAGSYIYGIYVFVTKMHQLTDMRVSIGDNNQKELNQRQLRMLYTTSKYVSLLTFAQFTTIITCVIMILLIQFMWDKYEGLSRCILSMVVSMDSANNLLCLYLQYPFAERYYDKYCACFGKLWQCILKNNYYKKNKTNNGWQSRLEMVMKNKSSGKDEHAAISSQSGTTTTKDGKEGIDMNVDTCSTGI